MSRGIGGQTVDGPVVPIVLFFAAAIGSGVVMIVLSQWLGNKFGPRDLTETKLDSFESGMPSQGYRGEGFHVKFFLVAILFILFDVEVICLYPWAVVFRDLGGQGLAAIGFFLLLLMTGYAYAWKRGALDWGA